MGCDFLFSLHRVLNWLFAFLMALLPQHLMAQLSVADFHPVPAYTAAAAEPRAVPPVAQRPPHEVSVASHGRGGSGDVRAHLVR